MELLDEDEVFDQREAVLTGLATRSKPLKEGAKVLDQLLEWEVLTETDYKVFRNKCKAAIAKTKVGKDGKKKITVYKKGQKPKKKATQAQRDGASALMKQTNEKYVADKFVAGGDPFC